MRVVTGGKIVTRQLSNDILHGITRASLLRYAAEAQMQIADRPFTIALWVRPLADEEVTDLHRTRLWLNDATRQVLANGLDLLGVSAPERM